MANAQFWKDKWEQAEQRLVEQREVHERELADMMQAGIDSQRDTARQLEETQRQRDELTAALSLANETILRRGAELQEARTELQELREAAEAVMVSHRPIKSKGKYVNPWYGPQIERLDRALSHQGKQETERLPALSISEGPLYHDIFWRFTKEGRAWHRDGRPAWGRQDDG